MSNKTLEFLFYMRTQQDSKQYYYNEQINIDTHFSENCSTLDRQHEFSNIIRKNKNNSNNTINDIQYKQCLNCSVIEF